MASGTTRTNVPSEADAGLRDTGTRRGFGGSHGANRFVDDVDDPTGFETLPAAFPAAQVEEPGRNNSYGSKGVDGDSVQGRVAKAALSG